MRLSTRFREWENTFDQPLRSIVIGRPKPSNLLPDLDLSPDLTVSRPHARLFLEEEKWWIEDLGSTHGTQINGDEIRGKGPRELASGDVILIGETEIRPDLEENDAPVAITDGEIAAQLPAAGEENARLGALSDRAARTLGRLNPLLLQCGGTGELDELLRELVARVVRELPGAARGALLLHARETDALLLTAFEGEGGPAVSETLARRAMKEGNGFIWRGEHEDDKTLVPGASIARFEISSALVAPLLWQGEALGVLCVDDAGGAGFSTDDLRIVLTVAHHMALALANRQLSDDLRRETALTANLLRQFSPQVAQHLLSTGSLQVSGERSEVTILASDIRGFTAMTRRMQPLDVVELLNDYFSRLTPIIHSNGGTIDKYIGDGILAVFGSPQPDAQQHEHALQAALEMQAEMAKSNAARAKKGKVTCEIGIGVHCGEVLHGFIGVLDQLSLTVIGDAVNRASRYCSAAKSGEIILSPQIFQWVWKDVEAAPVQLTTKHGEQLAAYRLIEMGDPRD